MIKCTRCQKEKEVISIKVEKPEWMVDVQTPTLPIYLCKDCIDNLETIGCKFTYD